jgi:thimet oligopeptidase
MKKKTIQLLLCSVTIIFFALLSYSSRTPKHIELINKIFHTPDIISLFSLTPDDIKTNTPQYITQAKSIIDGIIAISDDQRTYANTAQPLDEILSLSNLTIAHNIYQSLELLHPDQAIRDAAHDAFLTIQAFLVDYVVSNKALYDAFIAYMAKNDVSKLSNQQRYFINDTIDSFKREGLSLPDETLAFVNVLRKELAQLTADFDRNIAQDKSFITVTHTDLEGIDNDFIVTLKKTDDDLYILGVDYPTYFRIMENCSVASTRQKLYIAFNNRAYPANEELLKTIINKRDELARLLGYADFAHYDIDSQMAHTPERAQAFIDDLIDKSTAKIKTEIAILTTTLPASVTLTSDGKIQPWDMAYLKNNYKKTNFNLDEQKIAEYFPMQKTVDELLDIYHQFFNIDFQKVPSTDLWHKDVTMIRVLHNSEVIGTLMLDLYPRLNKYNHAAQVTIVPGVYTIDGMRSPNISIVIANFPQPTAIQPSLLKRAEVETFFHEFGHALHAILGATEIASLSGTRTKTDFVELPSQMLEEWLMNKDILKKVSSHYITGQQLPDDVIDTIIKLRNLTSGQLMASQVYLANIALSYFGQGKHKDPQAIMQQLHSKIMLHTAFSPDNHLYTSFVHLTGYGAKYYGYLWSKVFALDIFATIKKHGLLNPEIGQKYIKEVLSKGGAQDPNELLYNFLGREPNTQAFFEEMGLK